MAESESQFDKVIKLYKEFSSELDGLVKCEEQWEKWREGGLEAGGEPVEEGGQTQDGQGQPEQAVEGAQEAVKDSSQAELLATAVLAALDEAEAGRPTPRSTAMRAHIRYSLSKIKLYRGEDQAAGQLLKSVYQSILEQRLDPHVCYLYFYVVNNLCFCLEKQKKYDEGRTILEKMLEDYRSLEPCWKGMSCEEVFGGHTTELTGRELEAVVTKNVQMLCLLCNLLGEEEAAGKSYHLVLRRQLELGQGEPLEWVKRTITLATYFITHNMFREAKMHLLAAGSVLKKKDDAIKDTDDEKEKLRIQWREIELLNAWVQYSLSLLTASCQLPVEEEEHSPIEMAFPELEQVEGMGEEEPDDVVKDPSQAKEIGLRALARLQLVKEALNPLTHPSQFVSACLVESDLLRLLYDFTSDFSEEYSLMRKRQEVLEEAWEALGGESECAELVRRLAETHARLTALELTHLRHLGGPDQEETLSHTLEQLLLLQDDTTVRASSLASSEPQP